MAGIGSRDRAKPIIVRNQCLANAMAGIGDEGRAESVIVDNDCRQNARSGIGVRGNANATIIVKDSATPAHVFGNKARANKPNQRVLELTGASGVIAGNVLQK